jgi:hypothetical protein
MGSGCGVARSNTDRSPRRKRVAEADPLESLDLDFSQSATTWRFLQDDSFFRGLLGPVGSGKSYACAAEVLLRAAKQPPSPLDNTRYSRFVVVRNSYPELRTTTLKTWTDLFPENRWGPLRWSPPITHHLQLPPRDGVPGLDCEVIFLALDKPKDVRKLLSLELTGAWINEARELPLAVVQGLTHRVGRYPTKANGGAPWRGIWADTNPMDDDHWWYRLAEKEPIGGRYKWTFFKQPAGMVQVEADAPDAVPGAGRWWQVNPKAENINNLAPGYYEQQLGGKDLDWISCYVAGQYVFVKEGRPVWPEYDDVTMVSDSIEVDRSASVHVGLDFGLTPAAVFGQRTAAGAWHILHELVTEDMGLERFAQHLLYELNTRFSGCKPEVWGDPAGGARDQIFEVTSFDHLRSLGLHAQPTASNDFQVRRESAAAPMQRLVNGKPGLLVHQDCRRLRKSLAGGYHFKRVGISGGTDRFRDAPHKDQHSHVGDAFGYLLLGGGEHRRLVRGAYVRPQQPMRAKMDFRVL